MRRRSVVALAVAFVLLDAAILAFVFLRSRPIAGTAQPNSPSAPPTSGGSQPEEPSVIEGPLLLAGAEDGTVLRVTLGDCGAGEPARAWVAPRGEQGEAITVPGLAQTLAVYPRDGGWRLIGTDDQCEVTAWNSRGYTARVWSNDSIDADELYLAPDRSGQLATTAGQARAGQGCSATQVHNLGEGRAKVLCFEGAVQDAAVSAGEFTLTPDQGSPGRAVAAAWKPDGTGAFLSGDASCAASIVTVSEGRSAGFHCFGPGRAPLGVAWAGDTLVAQVGYLLFDRRGTQWKRR